MKTRVGRQALALFGSVNRETSQAVERRPGQILERHDMAEDSTIQAGSFGRGQHKTGSYGRGQHKTGSFGDDMLRPSPNHGTQRLPNDDDDDE